MPTIEEATIAYNAAKANVTKQNSLLTQAAAAAAASDAPFGNSSTVVREGYRIPEEAMVVIRKLQSVQSSAHAALDFQTSAASSAIAAKDQAKMDLNNAVRDSDITDAVEQTA